MPGLLREVRNFVLFRTHDCVVQRPLMKKKIYIYIYIFFFFILLPQKLLNVCKKGS